MGNWLTAREKLPSISVTVPVLVPFTRTLAPISPWFRCFSHVHAWQLSAIPVLPTTGVFKGHLGANKYGSKYTHEKETVKAGYHQVYLEDYQIDAELTATTRVGFHRYTFPKSEESHIHVDFSTFLGPSDTESGAAKKVSDREIAGYALMALFSMDGGTATAPTYEIASPIFDKITLHLEERFYPGKQFVIEAKNNSATNLYVRRATLNGQPLHQYWFYHKDLVKGGKLVLEMGPAK